MKIKFALIGAAAAIHWDRSTSTGQTFIGACFPNTRIKEMKTLALLFALVVLSAPASAGPYDNQLTMAEWNVATVPQRMGVARMLISALKPGTAHPMVHTVELKACVDAVAIEPRLGHLKLSDVSLSCAMKMGWR